MRDAIIVKRFPSDAGLTPREQEVLVLYGAGLTSKEIGIRLGISMLTIKNHLQRIRTKFGLEGTRKLRCLAALLYGSYEVVP